MSIITINNTTIDLSDFCDFSTFEEHLEELGINPQEYTIITDDGEVTTFMSKKGMLEECYFQYQEMDDSDKEVIKAYFDNITDDIDDLSDIMDKYLGEYDSLAAFAEEMTLESGVLADVPDHIKRYIDYDAMGRDLNHDFDTVETGNGIMIFTT